MNKQLHKRLVAEMIGTFCLVLAGTCAIVVNGEGVVSHVGVALTFGLIVFAVIAAWAVYGCRCVREESCCRPVVLGVAE